MKKIVVLAATAVTALTALTVPAQASATQESARVHYKNGATDMCLAIGRGEVRAGKKVIQWPCIKSKSQQWIYRGRRLVNAKTGMCLAIAHGAKRKGQAAIQWPCTDGGLEQEWIYDGLQRLKNRKTEMCLAVGHGEAKAGKRVIQWPCKDTAEQAWLIR